MTEAHQALNADLLARGFRLEVVDDHLTLRDLENPKSAPLEVDFLTPQMRYRLAHGLSKSQPLSKAIGLKSRAKAPSIFDATAGLGTDSFFLAAMGCRVQAVERSPVIFALLEDGARRLREEVALHEISARLSFAFGSGLEALQSLTPENQPEVVYLDPMYPLEGHESSALPKKAMQIFRRLLGDAIGTADDEALFHAALSAAKARVVVKRPVGGALLAGARPAHSFESKAARFDLYLTSSAN